MSKLHQTMTAMMQQRGYEIIEDTPEMLVSLKPNGDKVCVFLNVIEKFSVDEFKNCVSRLEELDIPHCIAIYNDMTSAAKKMIKNTSNLILATNHRSLEFESFDFKEVQFIATRHNLVPKHEKVEAKEAENFQDKDKHPILRTTDPIARFYAFKRGDLIKITRKGGFVAYRVVK